MISFSVDKTSVNKYEMLRLVYTGTTESPAPVSYVWDFGDGIISNELNPKVYFKSTGLKSVSLTVYFDDSSIDSYVSTDLITVVDTLEVAYKDLLTTQFHGTDNIGGLVAIIANRHTIGSSDSDYLLYSRKIARDNFTIFLDDLGELLGLPRNDRNNSDYADALGQMYVVSTSHSQLEAIIKYSELFVDPTTIIVHSYLGIIVVSLSGSALINYRLFKQRLESVAAGGVRVVLMIAAGGTGAPLEFEYTDEPAINADSGLSEYGGSYVGGYFAELYL